MMILWLPLLFLIPLAILWTTRSGSAAGFMSPEADDSMAVARRRFARGEITTAQFEEIRRLLS